MKKNLPVTPNFETYILMMRFAHQSVLDRGPRAVCDADFSSAV